MPTSRRGRFAARSSAFEAELDSGSGPQAQLQADLQRLRTLETLNSGGATVIERPTSADKVSPAPIRDSLLGGAIGLVVALLVAAIREAMNTRVRSEGDVEDMLGKPVLATIQSLPRRVGLVTVGRHETRYGDTYGLLAATLMQISGEKSGRVLAVTSAVAGEGKTTTATNLAVALALRGQNVVLADFDTRKPSLGGFFRIPEGSPGSGNSSTARQASRMPSGPCRSTARPPAGAQQPPGSWSDNGNAHAADERGWLRVVPSGGHERGARVARSPRIPALLADLGEDADLVILDTPPALATVEMAELAPLVDFVLVVVRHGRVTRRSLQTLSRQAEGWRSEIDRRRDHRLTTRLGRVLLLRDEVAGRELGRQSPMPRADLPFICAGFALTAMLALAATQIGEGLSLALIVVLTLFFAMVTAFVVVPHIAVALTIPTFALIPMLKVLAFPWIGPLKDMITMAAICAAAVLVVQRSSQGLPQKGDFWVAAASGLFAILYLVNVGGLNRDLAWTHGVRLALEPLALLLVGLTLPNARRTLRWAMGSLVVTAVFVAAVGLSRSSSSAEWALYDLGYSFRVQLRTVDGHLRSFGTLDEPFAYAAFLLLALAALLMWFRLSALTLAAGSVIMAGLFFSFVRTALVVVLALGALWLARKGYTATSVFLLGVAAVSALVHSLRLVDRDGDTDGSDRDVELPDRQRAHRGVAPVPQRPEGLVSRTRGREGRHGGRARDVQGDPGSRRGQSAGRHRLGLLRRDRRRRPARPGGDAGDLRAADLPGQALRFPGLARRLARARARGRLDARCRHPCLVHGLSDSVPGPAPGRARGRRRDRGRSRSRGRARHRRSRP